MAPGKDSRLKIPVLQEQVMGSVAGRTRHGDERFIQEPGLDRIGGPEDTSGTCSVK